MSAPAHIDCLLLSTGEHCWLLPASLVTEVVAHFAEAAPSVLAWRGHNLPCLDDGAGRVRALAVLRRLGIAEGARFYAIALREPPRQVAVRSELGGGDVDRDFEIDGRRAVVFDARAVEARLPADD